MKSIHTGLYGAICACTFALLAASTTYVSAAVKTATWNELGDGVSYNDLNNWDIGEVPIDNVSDTFVVIIPNSAAVNFDVPGAARRCFN